MVGSNRIELAQIMPNKSAQVNTLWHNLGEIDTSRFAAKACVYPPAVDNQPLWQMVLEFKNRSLLSYDRLAVKYGLTAESGGNALQRIVNQKKEHGRHLHSDVKHALDAMFGARVRPLIGDPDFEESGQVWTLRKGVSA